MRKWMLEWGWPAESRLRSRGGHGLPPTFRVPLLNAAATARRVPPDPAQQLPTRCKRAGPGAPPLRRQALARRPAAMRGRGIAATQHCVH